MTFSFGRVRVSMFDLCMHICMYYSYKKISKQEKLVLFSIGGEMNTEFLDRDFTTSGH